MKRFLHAVFFIICVFPALELNAQATVYYDNFQAYTNDWSTFAGQSPANSGIPYGGRWTIYSPSGAFGHGAFMNSTGGVLRQDNVYYANGPDMGFFWIYKAADNWAAANKLYETSSSYTSTFTNNDSMIVWTIAFRTSTNPTGLSNNTQYGGAFILGTNAVNMGVGCNTDSKGYAVVFGDASGDAIGDAIRFVRFDNSCNSCSPCGTAVQSQYGLFNWNGTNSTNTILCATDLGNVSSSNWYSVKVTFDPTTDTWGFYARNDGGTKADPNTLNASHCKGQAVDNTFTGTALPFMGMYGSMTSSSNNIRWDDLGIYQMPVAAGPGCGSVSCSASGTPSSGTVNSFCAATLNWNAVTGTSTSCMNTLGATNYNLNFGTNNPPSNILSNSAVGNTTSYNATGLNPNTTYYWSVTPTNGATSASGCTTYSFTTGNATAPANVAVCANGNTSFTSNNNVTGESIQWQVSTNGGGSWSNLSNVAPYSGVNGTTLSLTGVTAGMNGYQYHAVVSLGGCSVTTAAAVLTVNPTPTVNISGTQSICSGQNTVLTAGTASSYVWSPGGATTSTVSVSPGTGTTTYTVVGTSGTCTASAVASVTVSPTPTLNVSGTQSICTGQSTTLTAATAASYVWSPGGATTNTLSVTPGLGTTTYTVVGTSGTCTASTVATVTVNPLPNASAGSNQVITCSTPAVTLTGSSSTPGVNYSWSSGVSPANAATGSAGANGTYTLTVTNPSTGCSNTSTVAVTTNTAVPNISMGSGQTITCATSTATVSGSSSTPGASYSWSSGVSPANAATGTVAAAGVYTLTVTDPANGCTTTGTIAVTSNGTLPNVSAGANQTITCTSSTVTVSGSSSTPGVNYSWSSGVTPNNASSGSVSAPGTYTLTVTNPSNGCSSATTISVNTNTATPNISVGSGQTITCATTTATVSGSSSTGGVNYSWSSGVTPGNSASGSVSAAGIYTLTITNPANGCSTTGTVAVSTNTTTPNISVGSSQTITCTSSAVMVSGNSSTGGATYAWSSGVTPSNAATGSVSSAGIYTLTVTDPANGCTSSGTVAVSTNTVVPDLTMASTVTTLNCLVTSASISGTSTVSNPSYSWSAGVTPNNAPSGDVSAAGVYTLTVTDQNNGCTTSATVSVTANITPPDISVGPNQVIDCNNTSVTISGSTTTSPASTVWIGPGIGTPTNSLTAVVSAAGTYTFTVTDQTNKCVSLQTLTVSSNTTTPNISVSSATDLTCTNLSSTVSGSSATPGAVYSWSSGVLPGNTASGLVAGAGTYTLTVTDPANGCSSSDVVTVAGNTTVPNVNAGAGQTLTCAITSVTLSGSSSTAGAAFSWEGPSAGSPAGNTPANASTDVNAAGTYTLTVTDPGNGCTATSTVVVTPDSNLPNVTAGANQTIDCNNTSATVSGSSSAPGVTYSWSSGVTPGNTSSGTVTSAGVYTLTVTDPNNGCSSATAITVTTNTTVPDAGVSANTAVINCTNTSATLTGLSITTNATFSWSAGVTPGNSASGTVNSAGTYTLTVTDPSNGCTNSSVTVNVTADTTQPDISVAGTQTITCGNNSATVSGSSLTPNAVYSWSAGVSPNNASSGTVNAAGTYILTITNPANGCSDSASVVVVLNGALPAVAVANASLGITCVTTSVTLSGSSSTGGVAFSWEGPASGTPAGNTPSNSSTDVTQSGTYTLTVTDAANGCSATATVVVNTDTIVPDAAVSANNAVINCTTATVTLNGSSATPNATFVWSAGVTPGNTASGTANAAGTYTLTVTDPTNGCANSSVTVNVSVDTLTPSISASAGANAVIDCANPNVSLTAAVASGNNVTWTGPAGAVSGNPATITNAGTYTATVTNPANGCTNSTTVAVSANTTAPAISAGASGDTLSCANTTANLSASSSSNNTVYNWSGPNSFTASGQNVNGVSNAGQYIVTVTDTSNGCTATDTVNIVQGSNPTAGFTFSPNGGQAPLNVNFTNTSMSGFTSYQWNLGNGTTTTQTNPADTYTASGTYTVTLIAYGSTGACNDTVVQILTVDEQISISVPNIFTPNGDGTNDIFFISTSGIKDMEVDIYNRWGQIVKQLYGISATWDGTNINTEPASDGTYYYMLKATGYDGKEIKKEGYIQLTR